MTTKSFRILFVALCFSCNNNASSAKYGKITPSQLSTSDENPYKKISEIPLPDGFSRVLIENNSFGSYLRNVALKTDKTVYKFNGMPKGNQLAQFAVLNISVGDKDLQQCADAVMRLRAEYLFEQHRFNEINFKDNDGKTIFTPPYNRQHFTTFLEQVFGMCGSASLAKQLNTVADFNSIHIGDVIIRGGFPGHAVQVMDIAANKDGEKIYLLAQGFMPAQDIHVLVNDLNSDLSPWYKVDNRPIIKTPEYTFSSKELKRW
ncbi:MAG: hypothetical protein IPP48_12010 [Chitinophagaceae bacterium]|nr:hypothetical protein [Chitinophagaceae bacterium]